MFKPKHKVNSDKTELTVTVTLKPAKLATDKQRYNTDFVKSWAASQGYDIKSVIEPAVVSNYEEDSKRKGKWIFALREKAAAARPVRKTTTKTTTKTKSSK
tara:strand:- start:4352 stop:4654 length:303 start_codon:yes stop_codon:yes gene_type:complete